jgi:hypothetical protein
MVVLGCVGCGAFEAEDAPEQPPRPRDSSPTDVQVVVPPVTTPFDQLDVAGYDHHEVLRIVRDFGDRNFEIALDAWTEEGANGAPKPIVDVRLWWAKLHAGQERGPFGPSVRGRMRIETAPDDDGSWAVRIIADGKVFAFTVHPDEQAIPRAFGTVVTPGGAVEHCRAESARLRARRVVGVPVGIDRLEVSCTDGDGEAHAGHLRAEAELR